MLIHIFIFTIYTANINSDDYFKFLNNDDDMNEVMHEKLIESISNRGRREVNGNLPRAIYDASGTTTLESSTYSTTISLTSEITASTSVNQNSTANVSTITAFIIAGIPTTTDTATTLTPLITTDTSTSTFIITNSLSSLETATTMITPSMAAISTIANHSTAMTTASTASTFITTEVTTIVTSTTTVTSIPTSILITTVATTAAPTFILIDTSITTGATTVVNSSIPTETSTSASTFIINNASLATEVSTMTTVVPTYNSTLTSVLTTIFTTTIVPTFIITNSFTPTEATTVVTSSITTASPITTEASTLIGITTAVGTSTVASTFITTSSFTAIETATIVTSSIATETSTLVSTFIINNTSITTEVTTTATSTPATQMVTTITVSTTTETSTLTSITTTAATSTVTSTFIIANSSTITETTTVVTPSITTEAPTSVLTSMITSTSVTTEATTTISVPPTTYTSTPTIVSITMTSSTVSSTLARTSSSTVNETTTVAASSITTEATTTTMNLSTVGNTSTIMTSLLTSAVETMTSYTTNSTFVITNFLTTENNITTTSLSLMTTTTSVASTSIPIVSTMITSNVPSSTLMVTNESMTTESASTIMPLITTATSRITEVPTAMITSTQAPSSTLSSSFTTIQANTNGTNASTLEVSSTLIVSSTPTTGSTNTASITTVYQITTITTTVAPSCNISTQIQLPNNTCVLKNNGQIITVNILRGNTTNSTVIAQALSLYISSITNSNVSSNSNYTLTVSAIDNYLGSINSSNLTINTNDSFLMASAPNQPDNSIVLGASFVRGTGGQIVSTLNEGNVINSNVSTAAILNYQSLSNVKSLNMMIINSPTAFQNIDNSTNKTLASSVVLVNIQRNSTVSNPINISLFFQILNEFQPNVSANYFCSFYDTYNLRWNESGCSTPTFNTVFNRYECSCDHLTSFALLWLPQGQLTTYLNASDIASLVCLSISIVCFLAIIIHAIALRILDPVMSFKSYELLPLLSCASTTILFIFYIALGMTVYTRTSSTNESQCFLSSSVLMFFVYFFLIFMFCTKTSVGYFNYLRFICLFPQPSIRKLLTLLILSFFISITCVAFAIGFNSSSSYNITQLYPYKLCWFTRDVIYYFLTIPVGAFLLINTIVFILVALRIINHARHATSPHQSYERMKRCVLILLSSSATQGIGWLFGPFLTFISPEAGNILGWFFIIFNGLEGLWSIILYIILRSKHMDDQKRVTAAKQLSKEISSKLDKDKKSSIEVDRTEIDFEAGEYELKHRSRRIEAADLFDDSSDVRDIN
ncbi:unnamed protein product [Rotaria socialis]|uniref:Uncharacterized protein n=1 Tax=Rotaria socialis TaxID=392032 RepID=A0A820YQF5_9BILA|nr:unnamed protein product [Rotaria socialis]